jgi:hypothetical protein
VALGVPGVSCAADSRAWGPCAWPFPGMCRVSLSPPSLLLLPPSLLPAAAGPLVLSSLLLPLPLPLARGAAKKNDGPPRSFAKSQTHPPISQLFVSFYFFITYSKTPHKHHKNIFTKSPCRTKPFPKKLDKNFDVSFSSIFCCCIVVSGGSQRWEFKSTTRNLLQKKSRRRVFAEHSTKNPKPIFPDFILSRFLAFLGDRR